jgi:quercetin dioxygenase-like cupin family protein
VRSASARAALLAALALCAPACTSSPDPAPAAPAGDEAPAAGAADDDAPTMKSGRVGHWSVLRQSVVHALDQKGPSAAFIEAPLARGEHLDVQLIAARGAVPGPKRAADEVLIFVEGPQAVLTVDDTRYEVAPGTIALLPAGSRRTLVPRTMTPTDPPVFVIVARTVATGTRGADTPWVADLAALDPVLLASPREGNAVLTPIVALAERIGIFVLSFPGPSPDRSNPGKVLYPSVPPQYHRQHDEALLLLSGEGNVGLGTVGHRAQTASLVLVPTDLPYYFMSDSPDGTRCLLIAAPALAGKDVDPVPPPDPDEVRRVPPPTRVQAPLNGPADDTTERPAGAVGDVREGERPR